MRKKIIIGLLAFLVILSAGILLSLHSISSTSDELTQVIKLHEIEQLRRSLAMGVQTVQANLYTVDTLHSENLDSIINNVNSLHGTAAQCTECHHSPKVTNRLIAIQSLITEYETNLSYYLTASANKNRMQRIKDKAIQVGSRILNETERMSHKASEGLRIQTESTSSEVESIKSTLKLTLLLCFAAGSAVAINLARSISTPINKITSAVKKIEAGRFGSTVDYTEDNEFGALATQFNEMSTRIEAEIINRKKTEESLRESEERYSLSVEGANDGLWDWNLNTGSIYFSSRWKSMLGYADEEVGTDVNEWFQCIHPDDREQVAIAIKTHIEGLSANFEHEYRMFQKNGNCMWVLSRGIVVRDDEGKAYRMAGSQSDITERKVAADQLIHDALHDTLTNLPNRTLFLDHLTLVSKRTARDEKNKLFAVLFLDLDNFKMVNDSLGHMAGDKLLILVSQRLCKTIRPGDTVARLGGDEFVILLEDIKDLNSARQLTNRIENEFLLPFNLGEKEVHISASIGVCYSNVHHEKPEDLLRNADIAMYRAKSKGRNCHETFDSLMYDEVIASTQMTIDLRDAVAQQDFTLFYQPVFSIPKNRIIGFEALIRWQHPELGFVPPDKFIPLAEETGLIQSLGKWILKEACQQISAWQEQFRTVNPLSMSVNVSAKQLVPELINQVADVLQESGINASSLALELTETACMDNTQDVLPILLELKSMGVQLHIDDFGTGYSSLSYLHKFPVDVLKIDQSFISGMNDSSENHEIIRTIREMAKSLNMSVTAEGVENYEQLVALTELDCTHVQGFLISKPLCNYHMEEILPDLIQIPPAGESLKINQTILEDMAI